MTCIDGVAQFALQSQQEVSIWHFIDQLTLRIEARLLGYANPFGTEATLPATICPPVAAPLCPEGISVSRHEGQPGGVGDIAPTYPLPFRCEGQLIGRACRHRQITSPEAAVILLEGEDGIDTAPVNVDPPLSEMLIRRIVDIIIDVLVEDTGLDLQPSLLVVEGNDGFVATLATQGATPETTRTTVVQSITIKFIDIRSTPSQAEVGTCRQIVGEAVVCSKAPGHVGIDILLPVAQTTPVTSSSIGDAVVIAQTRIEEERIKACLLDEVTSEIERGEVGDEGGSSRPRLVDILLEEVGEPCLRFPVGTPPAEAIAQVSGVGREDKVHHRSLCPLLDLAVLILTAVVILVGSPELEVLTITDAVADITLEEQVLCTLARCLNMVGEGRDVDGVRTPTLEDLLKLEEVTDMRPDEDATLSSIQTGIEGSTKTLLGIASEEGSTPFF